MCNMLDDRNIINVLESARSPCPRFDVRMGPCGRVQVILDVSIVQYQKMQRAKPQYVRNNNNL